MSDDPRTYAGWVSAFEASTDFEADLVRDRLGEADIDAVVLTQRDHSFNLNVGDLSPVHVMVRPEDHGRAREVLDQAPVSDADLEAAAMAADVMAPDAYTPDAEAMLDSGLDALTLGVPDEIANADERDDEAPAHPAGPTTDDLGATDLGTPDLGAAATDPFLDDPAHDGPPRDSGPA